MSILTPLCPFCREPLGYPEEIRLSETETVLGGQCFLCKAHFIVDPTGKNVGEVMVQGLQMAAEELGTELALLVDGEDYEDCVLSYDIRRHASTGPGGFFDGCGRMYVIKVNTIRHH